VNRLIISRSSLKNFLVNCKIATRDSIQRKKLIYPRLGHLINEVTF
ncbi:6933_t:CDS:2, partial [Racocetra persica]